MGIVTDATPVTEPKDPDANNVFALYKLFATPGEVAKMADLFRNPMLDADGRGGRPFGYGDAKTILLGKLDTYFAPFRERRRQLAAEPQYVERVLADGARRAREVAR